MTTEAPETRAARGWQAIKALIAEGKCRDCRQPRGEGGTKHRCASCKDKRNKYLATWRGKTLTSDPDERPVRVSQGAALMRRKPAPLAETVLVGHGAIEISMTSRRAEPGATADPEWEADHWSCRIVARRTDDALHPTLGTLRVPFSMGKAHNGRAPVLSEVLSALVSDARGLDDSKDFADWCAQIGLDVDSRRAERIYRAVKRHTRGLLRMLGKDAMSGLAARFDPSEVTSDAIL